MVPLAMTSTAGWIRRLGGKRWQTLHRLIYGTAIAGVIHYYWLVKSDVRKPLFYGALVALLLAYRSSPRPMKRVLAADAREKCRGRYRASQRTERFPKSHSSTPPPRR